MTAKATLIARDARLTVLRAEYGAQQRSLRDAERELSVAATATEQRQLRQAAAWHRRNLERLAERLRA